MKQTLRIGLDIDEVLADFMGTYLTRFGTPKNDATITKNVHNLKKDRSFWENLPQIREIDFTPVLYCTKRINPKVYTKTWLAKFNFPAAPVYQMFYQKGNKAAMIKGRIDVFIDDSVANFKQMNESGVPCLLMDTPYNRHFKTKLRINTLTLAEITNTYNEFF